MLIDGCVVDLESYLDVIMIRGVCTRRATVAMMHHRRGSGKDSQVMNTQIQSVVTAIRYSSDPF